MPLFNHFGRDRPKAFLTDVFGTVVNWRKSVEEHLEYERDKKLLSAAGADLPANVRKALKTISWPDFARRWRISYYNFTRAYDPKTMAFKTIDEHHIESLHQLIDEYGIHGVWTDDEIAAISLIWHRLEPWTDSAPGLKKLSQDFITATLSNGGQKLLRDLCEFGNLTYEYLVSSEDFGAYKPNPIVYTGAVRCMPDCVPADCCLVAAHLGDLQAAKQCGYKTVYIERPQEESWTIDQVEQAKKDGFVDMWITIDEDGFNTIAKQFHG